MIYVWIDLIFC